MMPLKNKEGDPCLEEFKLRLSRLGIDPSMVDLYGDAEFKVIGEWIEKKGGTYNSGTANRSNSHARAENVVKNALGAQKSASVTSACPAKNWSDQARVLSTNTRE